MPSTAMSNAPPTAILSALPQEQHGLMELLQHPRKVTHAGRDFWQGDLHGQSVVLALVSGASFLRAWRVAWARG
jgi:adenosylhomocysteine nucleosidase